MFELLYINVQHYENTTIKSSFHTQGAFNPWVEIKQLENTLKSPENYRTLWQLREWRKSQVIRESLKFHAHCLGSACSEDELVFHKWEKGGWKTKYEKRQQNDHTMAPMRNEFSVHGEDVGGRNTWRAVLKTA